MIGLARDAESVLYLTSAFVCRRSLETEKRLPETTRPTSVNSTPVAPKGGGIGRTFRVLARSRAPGSQETLLAGLEEGDADIQLAAARAILKSDRRGVVPKLIESFDKLSPKVGDALVRHLDNFIYPLREILDQGEVQARANTVEIIIRANQVKLAYLLVQALSDVDEKIASRALDGLKQLTEHYHRQAEQARSGAIELSRTEIENKKFALLDPMLSLLGNLTRRQPDELLLLAMGLDVRTNDMLFAILNSKQDPRAEKLNRLLLQSSAPQIISFVLDCLRDRRVSTLAATVIEKRRDLPFARGLLANDRFFTDYRVREKLELVEELSFLRSKKDPNLPREDVFANAVSALRGMHFLVLSGVPAEDKTALLRAVGGSAASLFVRGIAENVLTAMQKGRHKREVSLALVHLENVMGIGPGIPETARRAPMPAALEMPELELPWAHPETQSLPADAFTQFFNTFDALDDATKLLAVAMLKQLDPTYLEHIQQELASLEGTRRLRAVKIVVMFHREQDVQETLVRLTSDRDRRVRATVVKTLGLLEDQVAIRALLQAVTDADRRVVANSVEALESTGREEMLGLVRIFAAHPNNRIRANAIKALWSMGDTRAASLLDAMLRSDDEMMRLSATWLLGEIDLVDRIDILLKLSKTDASERVRQKALMILGEKD